MSFAVCVSFQIHLENFPAFLSLVSANAAQSLQDEPGCRQFDVLSDPDRPGEVFLYEIYSDAAAFDAHLATPHFLAFDAAVADMILAKDVRTYRKVTS